MLDPQKVKLFYTNPDILFSDSYSLPRMSGQYPLILSLNSFMAEAYKGMQSDWIMYGKPSRNTFEYAEDVVRRQAREMDIDISNIYMIGDNPRGDIAGPNSMGDGWKSILVHSGIYQPDQRADLPEG